jgi:hypothetical protein
LQNFHILGALFETLICESKRNKRYDSTGLLSDKWQLTYIEVLYTGGGVHPTGSTVTRGVASSLQIYDLVLNTIAAIS